MSTNYPLFWKFLLVKIWSLNQVYNKKVHKIFEQNVLSIANMADFYHYFNSCRKNFFELNLTFFYEPPLYCINYWTPININRRTEQHHDEIITWIKHCWQYLCWWAATLLLIPNHLIQTILIKKINDILGITNKVYAHLLG